MKNYLIGAGIVLALILSIVGIRLGSSPKLGSYNPPIIAAGGFTQSLNTSTALSAGVFCSPNSVQFLGTSALATGTLAAATTTYVACPAMQNLGALSVGSKIVNDSTNTVNVVGGTGVTFKCETQGSGTSTVIGGCTSTGFSILATSTVDISEYFDTASSDLKVLVGNNSH